MKTSTAHGDDHQGTGFRGLDFRGAEPPIDYRVTRRLEKIADWLEQNPCAPGGILVRHIRQAILDIRKPLAAEYWRDAIPLTGVMDEEIESDMACAITAYLATHRPEPPYCLRFDVSDCACIPTPRRLMVTEDIEYECQLWHAARIGGRVYAEIEFDWAAPGNGRGTSDGSNGSDGSGGKGGAS